MTSSCYSRNNNTVISNIGQVPCHTGSGFQQCCAQGDICGGDGFCHFIHQQSQTVTGYYLGGCTDSAFADEACPQHCTSLDTQDVIYNTTDGLWRCCWGSGSLDCSSPSREAFSAPPIAQLFAASPSTIIATPFPTPSNDPSSAISSRTSTPTSTPNSVESSAPSSSGSTSASTLAPAIVVPALVLLSAFALGFWVWRRRRSSSTRSLEHGYSECNVHEVGVEGKGVVEMPAEPEHRNELEVKHPAAELHG